MSKPKIAFVFPGQGSQVVGMGRDLVETHEAARKVFEQADESLGCSLKQLCFEGPEEMLKDTVNAQPALLATSIAAYEAFRAGGGPEADMMAGHSLGEYSALVAAGTLDLKTGISLVRQRGTLMSEAARARGGAMAAVVGLPDETVQRLCEEADGTVVIANLNSPGQVVISGEAKAVEMLIASAKEARAKMVIPLPVSGAFHSPLMQQASEGMEKTLAEVPFNSPRVPVYANVTAQPYPNMELMKRLLVEQIVSQVRWTETIQNMIADGATHFVEMGSGKVLSGLIRRIDKSVTVYNMEDSASLEKTLTAFGSFSS